MRLLALFPVLALALTAALPLVPGAALHAADAPAAAAHAYPDITKADLEAAISAKSVVLID